MKGPRQRIHGREARDQSVQACGLNAIRGRCSDTIDTNRDIDQIHLQSTPSVPSDSTEAVTPMTTQDQQALKTNTASGHDQLIDALEGLNVGLVLWDDEFRFVFGNRLWHKTFFPNNPPTPGDDAHILMRRQMADGLYEIPEGMTTAGFEEQNFRLMREYGKDVPLRLANGQVHNASVFSTSLGGYLISFREITELVRSEKDAERQRFKTERANVRLRDALESIGEAFALFDEDDRLIMANALYKQANPASTHLMTFGRPRLEIIKAMATGGDLIGVDDWVVSYGDESAKGDTSSPRRYEIQHSDGRVFMASRGRTAEGGCTITWLDITDSKKTEMRARALVNDAIEALDEGFALFDAEMRFLFCNQKYSQIVLGDGTVDVHHGMAVEEVVGATFDSGIFELPGVTREGFIQAMRDFATGYQKIRSSTAPTA